MSVFEQLQVCPLAAVMENCSFTFSNNKPDSKTYGGENSLGCCSLHLIVVFIYNNIEETVMFYSQ